MFNAAYLERLLNRHGRGRELELHLWTLISFELWCRTFLDRRSTVTGPLGNAAVNAAQASRTFAAEART